MKKRNLFNGKTSLPARCSPRLSIHFMFAVRVPNHVSCKPFIMSWLEIYHGISPHGVQNLALSKSIELALNSPDFPSFQFKTPAEKQATFAPGSTLRLRPERG
jgi:hypothetical protein